MACWAPLICMLAAALPGRTQDAYNPLKPMTAEQVLLGRTRNVVAEMLKSMPNFTCVQTIERSHRAPDTKRFQMLDTLRLEVALVDGKELYAWPGSPKFEERDVRDMVGGQGAIGTGDFALHARSIFLDPGVEFKFLGREELNGRQANKFHYHVSPADSLYFIRIGTAEGVVGYQGHVWNDAATLELLRIELTVDEIPPNIPLKQGYKLIDYGQVTIGAETYILPTTMEMTLTGVNGGENRNRAMFSRCRQYMGESTLIFDDPPPDAAPKAAPVAMVLPPDLKLQARLAATLDLSKTATGDQVIFEVSKDAVKDGAVLAPKGARLEMRLDLVVCRDFPYGHCYVALVPVRFAFGGNSGGLRATLEFPPLERSIQLMFSNLRPEARLPPAEIGQASPGASLLLLRGSRGKVPSGFATVWRTLEPRGEDQP
ncbi:MAG: hypothetical protein HY858_00660 [Candidatus Solibacter usitatus]|nr:hypothetical protein [Candidatus Solibacter usitatus]